MVKEHLKIFQLPTNFNLRTIETSYSHPWRIQGYVPVIAVQEL